LSMSCAVQCSTDISSGIPCSILFGTAELREIKNNFDKISTSPELQNPFPSTPYSQLSFKGAQAWDFRLRFFCFKRTHLVPWNIT
jgi:hypothetical protein